MKKIYTLDCDYLYDWVGKYMKAYTSIEKACTAYIQLLNEFVENQKYSFYEDVTAETVFAEMVDNFNAQPTFYGDCEIIIEEWEIAK